MGAPTTYSEWVNLLESFGKGNDLALEELNKASFIVDAGTAARFYSRVEDAYKKRKQIWLDKFQRSFQFQNMKSDNDFEIILRDGKQNLSPLNKFVELKGIPEDLRNVLKKDLQDFVSEVKTSLKDNLSKIQSGKDKMLMMLNTFGINDMKDEIKLEDKNNLTKKETIPPTGRKIIF